MKKISLFFFVAALCLLQACSKNSTGSETNTAEGFEKTCYIVEAIFPNWGGAMYGGCDSTMIDCNFGIYCRGMPYEVPEIKVNNIILERDLHFYNEFAWNLNYLRVRRSGESIIYSIKTKDDILVDTFYILPPIGSLLCNATAVPCGGTCQIGSASTVSLSWPATESARSYYVTEENYACTTGHRIDTVIGDPHISFSVPVTDCDGTDMLIDIIPQLTPVSKPGVGPDAESKTMFVRYSRLENDYSVTITK
jgi:hypothetical protein